MEKNNENIQRILDYMSCGHAEWQHCGRVLHDERDVANEVADGLCVTKAGLKRSIKLLADRDELCVSDAGLKRVVSTAEPQEEKTSPHLSDWDKVSMIIEDALLDEHYQICKRRSIGTCDHVSFQFYDHRN